METFENRLRSLPVKRPPHRLRRRLFTPPARRGPWLRLSTRRIPLGWAALWALGLVAGGFWAGRSLRPDRSTLALTPAPCVQVRIMDSPASSHLFDFSPAATEFIPGPDLSVRVVKNEV